MSSLSQPTLPHYALEVRAGGRLDSALSAAECHRLEGLIDTYFDAIWRALRRLGVPAQNADDCAQCVFENVAKKLPLIRPEAERAYLYSVAVRVAANARRRLGKERERQGESEPSELFSDSPSPEEALVQRQARERLDAVLDAMDPDLRTVFTLFELEGLSGPEIALSLCVPEGTVASRLRRAREQFRKLVSSVGARSSARYGGLPPTPEAPRGERGRSA